MSIVETLLIFAGIPAAVVAAVFALVFGASGRRASKRYRPGRPFTFAPVWFIAARGTVEKAAGTGHAVTAGTANPALPSGVAAEEPVSVTHGETGGASDRW